MAIWPQFSSQISRVSTAPGRHATTESLVARQSMSLNLWVLFLENAKGHDNSLLKELYFGFEHRVSSDASGTDVFY